MMTQNPADSEQLALTPETLGNQFRRNLETLVYTAGKNGTALVALTTFSIHLRPGMGTDQRNAAMVTARYYMPYLSADDLLAGFERYNRIIREVALKTGALLIEQGNSIPGDPIHFNDSVHFTDAGSQKQADRVVSALVNSRAFQKIATLKRQHTTAEES